MQSNFNFSIILQKYHVNLRYYFQSDSEDPPVVNDSKRPILYLQWTNEPNYMCDAPNLPAAIKGQVPCKRKQSAAKARMLKKAKTMSQVTRSAISAAMDTFIKNTQVILFKPPIKFCFIYLLFFLLSADSESRTLQFCLSSSYCCSSPNYCSGEKILFRRSNSSSY